MLVNFIFYLLKQYILYTIVMLNIKYFIMNFLNHA